MYSPYIWRGVFIGLLLCITLRVIEMSDKKTKVRCRLTTCGTDKANAKAIDDLAIPDPEPIVGKKIIEEAVEEDIKDDGQSENS
jgi:hypothetical protein